MATAALPPLHPTGARAGATVAAATAPAIAVAVASLPLSIDAEVMRRMCVEPGVLDMTVEQFLMAKCNELQQMIADDASRLSKRLKLQYEAQREQMLAQMTEKHAPAAEADAKDEFIVTVTATAGPYEGQSWKLELKGKRISNIGRSTGKKFKENGLSLPNDDNVSTTHGKLFLKGSVVHYTDCNSSNGSTVNKKSVEPQVAIPLETGDEIEVGCTTLKVAIE